MNSTSKAPTSQSLHLPACRCSEQTGRATQRLSMPAAELSIASLAPTTIRAYRSALCAWDAFCSDRLPAALLAAQAGLPEHPRADGEVACNCDSSLIDILLPEYLTARYEAGASPATCNQIIGAIRFRAKYQGKPDPVGPAVQRVLADIKHRGRDRGRGQVDGLRWNEADAMARIAQRDNTLAGLRDAAIISVMSDALLRVSECVALNVEDFVRADQPDGSARIFVRQSRTDREGSSVFYIGPKTVSAVKAWLTATQIDDGPLFRRVRRGGHLGTGRLTARAIRNIVKQRAAAAGISGRFSGHSLRIGSAQSLAAAGASVVEMQIAGRWRDTSMPAHYARAQLAGTGAVARLRYGSKK